jgi:hypothetical protein
VLGASTVAGVTSFVEAIPRLDAMRLPDRHVKSEAPLFAPVQSLRPASVMISDELVDNSRGDREDYLLGLLAQDCFNVTRYRDGGPPASAVRKSEFDDAPVAPGWAIYNEGEDPAIGGSVVHFRGAQELRTWATDVDFERFAVEAGAKFYAGDAGRARRDVRAAAAAATVRADIFVTSRPFLRELPMLSLRDAVALSVDEALPIVGLYLRLQGRYIVSVQPTGKWPMSYNRGLFYWVAARDLMASGWRWRSCCCASELGNPDGPLGRLTETFHLRIARMLRARDQLHAALLRPPGRDVAEDALVALESVLGNLMSAMDASARVAHSVLGLGQGVHNAGWQRKAWLDRIDKAGATSLVSIVGPNTRGRAVLEVIRLLRNTVHAQAMSQIGVKKPSTRRMDYHAVLPLDHAAEIEEAIAEIGNLEDWGVDRSLEGRHYIEMRRFVENLVPIAVQILNDILAATPVELLGSVPVDDEGSGADEAWRSDYRIRIRWQLGL